LGSKMVPTLTEPVTVRVASPDTDHLHAPVHELLVPEPVTDPDKDTPTDTPTPIYLRSTDKPGTKHSIPGRVYPREPLNFSPSMIADCDSQQVFTPPILIAPRSAGSVARQPGAKFNASAVPFKIRLKLLKSQSCNVPVI